MEYFHSLNNPLRSAHLSPFPHQPLAAADIFTVSTEDDK